MIIKKYIEETMQKAKEVRGFAEKLITLSRKGTLAARRRAISMLNDRDIVSHEDGGYVKTNTVIGKLFSEIGPRYLDRQGGYTRIIRLSLKRLGDNGQLVLLQLVGKEENTSKKTKAKSAKKQTDKTEQPAASEEAPETVSVDNVQDVIKDEASDSKK